MKSNEKKLSDYIDSLNKEKMPDAHNKQADSPEMEELYNTVKMVRTLKEAALPDKDFPGKIAQEIGTGLPTGKSGYRLNNKRAKKPKQKWIAFAAVAAAIIITVTSLNLIMPPTGTNIVNAMERAYSEVKAYHGIMEVSETNAEGSNTIQAKLEVWADKEGNYVVKELEGSQKGMITANNGQQKWQLRQDEKEAYIFTSFPDPYRFTFEIGNEIEDAKNALETNVIGEEIISGRLASVIEVQPKGGAPYKIWVDKGTKMPLQKKSAMQNSLQYKVTYTKIENIEAVPAELITYKLPEGFKELNTNPEQMVATIGEAEEAAGFVPAMPGNVPDGFKLDGIAVGAGNKTTKLYYVSQDKKNKVVVLQGKASDEFKFASTSAQGKVGDSIAEIQSPVENDNGILSGGGAYSGTTNINSIRWQQLDMEYAVVGDVGLEQLGLFVDSIANGKLQLPEVSGPQTDKPQIDVPYDLEVEKNEQKSVDAGHSPWRLDPVYVAQVFVSLKISPEGITGDYPIAYEDLKVVKNDGVNAVIEVAGDKTPVRKVYLKRLVRQDSTGIWTVVGYDPANN